MSISLTACTHYHGPEEHLVEHVLCRCGHHPWIMSISLTGSTPSSALRRTTGSYVLCRGGHRHHHEHIINRMYSLSGPEEHLESRYCVAVVIILIMSISLTALCGVGASYTPLY
jgi:CDGSH-type Zn-finger protein